MRNIEQQLRTFLTENFIFARQASFGDDSSFLELGIIDSTGMLELVAFLERTYNVTLEDADLVPENLDSINSVAAFVRRKLVQAQDQAEAARSREPLLPEAELSMGSA